MKILNKLPIFLLAVILSFTAFSGIKTVKADGGTAETITSDDIVTGVRGKIASGSDTTEFSTAKYTADVLYGTIEEMKSFSELKAENGVGSDETYHTSSGADYTSAHLNKSFIRVSKGYGIFYKLVFTENVCLEIKNDKQSKDGPKAKITFTSYVSDGEYTVKRHSVTLPENLNNPFVFEGDLNHTLHLKKGNAYFFAIITDKTGISYSNALPSFVFSAEEYDETQSFDFAAYKKFRTRATEIADELLNYYLAKDSSLYSEANDLEMINIVAKATEELKTIEFGNDLEEYKRLATEKIDAVPTLEREAEELAESKAEKIKELKDYYTEKKAEGYDFTALKKIQAVIDKYEKTINGATDKYKLSAEYNLAKRELQDVTKTSSLTDFITYNTALFVIIVVGAALVIGAGAVIATVIVKKKKKGIKND